VGRGLIYGFGNIMTPRFHDPAEGRLERLCARFMEFGREVRDFLELLKAMCRSTALPSNGSSIPFIGAPVALPWPATRLTPAPR